MPDHSPQDQQEKSKQAKQVTMKELLRDTIFSHLVRVATGGKYFQYPEEKDPRFWQRYVHKEKTAHMAQFGQTEPPESHRRASSAGEQGNSASDSDTVVGELDDNGVPRTSVDPEKGRDFTIIEWYGDDDPEVSIPLWCLIIKNMSLTVF